MQKKRNYRAVKYFIDHVRFISSFGQASLGPISIPGTFPWFGFPVNEVGLGREGGV